MFRAYSQLFVFNSSYSYIKKYISKNLYRCLEFVVALIFVLSFVFCFRCLLKYALQIFQSLLINI